MKEGDRQLRKGERKIKQGPLVTLTQTHTHTK